MIEQLINKYNDRIKALSNQLDVEVLSISVANQLKHEINTLNSLIQDLVSVQVSNREIDVEKRSKILQDNPYYYKHDLSEGTETCVIYGKITHKTHTVIQEGTGDVGTPSMIRVLVESQPYDLEDEGLDQYFQEEYKSSESEFKEIVSRWIDFIDRQVRTQPILEASRG